MLTVDEALQFLDTLPSSLEYYHEYEYATKLREAADSLRAAVLAVREPSRNDEPNCDNCALDCSGGLRGCFLFTVKQPTDALDATLPLYAEGSE